jgi:hypothetical protein
MVKIFAGSSAHYTSGAKDFEGMVGDLGIATEP